jgi:hypothetical protein
MNVLDAPIAVTFFKNRAATVKAEELYTSRSLANRIVAITAARKDRLPWLKLARFGDTRTDQNCLRHDENVLAITGIEADYDSGAMTIDEACECLTKQCLASVIYTSPSHSVDAPRWRVLCPLSYELPPARRNHQLGRLNGLFRGVFANESWTLSQSYYFGSVSGNPAHRVEVIEGEPIDHHDDLDAIWLGKPGASKGAADVDQHASRETREDCELVRRIVTGEGFHVELCALAARYVGRGVSGETVVELLRGIMLSHPIGARNERWLDRYYGVDELVASAVKKYARAIEESQRALAKLTGRLIHDRHPSEQVRMTVLAEATQRGIEHETAERIITWVALREIGKRAFHNAQP